jgi:hypothetical protein
MPIPDPQSRQRLATMGIDLWLRRDRPADPVVAEAALAGAPDRNLRIRMASGSGEWLLVQREPWSGAHEKLLADIKAVMGADHCRFGQWAVSDSAGVPVDELESCGVRHVIAFGVPPRAVDAGTVTLAPALEEIASSADAKRRLWQLLAPLVAS